MDTALQDTLRVSASDTSILCIFSSFLVLGRLISNDIFNNKLSTGSQKQLL